MVHGLSPDEWEAKVPHCPEWSIRETIAHLAGVVDDAINANLGGVGTDPWTAIQVEKRSTVSGTEILNEWNSYAPFVEARFTDIGLGGSQGVFDIVTHEHDLRFALGQAGARQSDALRVGLYFIASRFENRTDAQFIVDGIELFVGNDRPTAGSAASATRPTFTLRASLFDVIRASSSRRSVDEIRALDLEGDFEAFLGLAPFGFPETSFGE